MIKGLDWRSPAWIGFFAFLLYLPTLRYGYVNYDDLWLIKANTLLQQFDFQSLYSIFFDLSVEQRLRLGSEYLPIRDLSVMLDFVIFGKWIGGYHLTNALLFGLLCAALVYALRLWTGLKEWSWLTGLLFAVHPIHVESVAWLSERKSLLAGLWMFVACIVGFRFAKRPSALGWLATAVCIVFAIWSKALAITCVGFLAGLMWFFPANRKSEDPNISSLLEELTSEGEKEEDTKPDQGEDFIAPIRPWLLPFQKNLWLCWAGWVVVAFVAFYPFWAVGQKVHMINTYHGGSYFSNLWLMSAVHLKYLSLLFFQGQYGIAYDIAPGGFSFGYGLAGALTFVGIALMAGLGTLFREGRLIFWGFTAFVWILFLLPVSQLVFPLQNYIADRYLFLPCLAWCMGVAFWTLSPGRRFIRLGGVTLILISALLLTFVQTETWSSTRSLYRQALKTAPDQPDILLKLASEAMDRGDVRTAQHWLTRAYRKHSKNSKVLLHWGLFHARMGRSRQAIQVLRLAVKDPTAAKARANLALLLLKVHQEKKALKWAREAAKIKPYVAHNQRALGTAALRNQKLKEARIAFEKAFALAPNKSENVFNIALIHFRFGHFKKARHYFAKVVRMRPQFKPRVALFLQEMIRTEERIRKQKQRKGTPR